MNTLYECDYHKRYTKKCLYCNNATITQRMRLLFKQNKTQNNNVMDASTGIENEDEDENNDNKQLMNWDSIPITIYPLDEYDVNFNTSFQIVDLLHI